MFFIFLLNFLSVFLDLDVSLVCVYVNTVYSGHMDFVFILI